METLLLCPSLIFSSRKHKKEIPTPVYTTVPRVVASHHPYYSHIVYHENQPSDHVRYVTH